MKRHIIETLLQEAVKLSKTEDIREMPLIDAVQKSLQDREETKGDLTVAERDALTFLSMVTNQRHPKWVEIDNAIATIDRIISISR